MLLGIYQKQNAKKKYEKKRNGNSIESYFHDS